MMRAIVGLGVLGVVALGLWLLSVQIFGRAPDSLSFGVGNRIGAPIAVIRQDIGGRPVSTPTVYYTGGADSTPRHGAGIVAPVPQGASIQIEATWIEVHTGQAFSASAEVAKSDLAVAAGSYDLVLVYLPGGWLVVGSDPGLVGGTYQTRDLARICGTRQPDQDRDLVAEGQAALDEFAGLEFALGRGHDPVTAESCSVSE